MRGGAADEILAPTRGRHRTARLRPGTGANHRYVTDAAVTLHHHATGRGCRGHFAIAVDGDCANSTVRAVRQDAQEGDPIPLALSRAEVLLPAFFGAEIGWPHQFQSLTAGETLGTGADQEHMRRVI